MDKLYPETLFYGERISSSGHQPVYKKLLPDGEPVELSPEPSQKLRLHSPDGFQWGYGGSGPAQLALALLLDATSKPEKALSYYQQFKWDKVASWGQDWRITRTEIGLWLALEEGREALSRLSKN
ncbi:hypothetical protein LCGC14_2509650 [marine sediment metagenome]|uniref:Uncharacterized protein n=1 Tax=marine sediment metagenome TaxID=412755 RepID=A0A0F9BME5_9ZZZZ